MKALPPLHIETEIPAADRELARELSTHLEIGDPLPEHISALEVDFFNNVVNSLNVTPAQIAGLSAGDV